MTFLTYLTLGAVLVAPTLLSAQTAEPTTRRVAIEYEELTRAQTMSMGPFMSHIAGLHLWEVGKPAKTPIQVLAEDGNGEWLLAFAVKDLGGDFGDVTVGLPAIPGGKRRVELQVTERHPLVSGAWMLGTTNDAFAGIDAIDAYRLKAPMTVEVFALDAGTEVNSETKATTAGLLGLGREPENKPVSRHTGIRGDADVPASAKFDPAKPVGRVTITPLQPAS